MLPEVGMLLQASSPHSVLSCPYALGHLLEVVQRLFEDGLFVRCHGFEVTLLTLRK